eukprot:jgi/Ulvmu1/109/UM001_0113.1
MRSSFRFLASSAFGRAQSSAPLPAAAPCSVTNRPFAAASRLSVEQEDDFSAWRHFNKRMKRSRRQFVRAVEWSDSDDEDHTPYPAATNRLHYPKFKPHKTFNARPAAHRHPLRHDATEQHQPSPCAGESPPLNGTSCHSNEEKIYSISYRARPASSAPGQQSAAAMSTVAYGAKLTPTSSWTPLSSEDLSEILPTRTSARCVRAAGHQGHRDARRSSSQPRRSSDNWQASGRPCRHGPRVAAQSIETEEYYKVEYPLPRHISKAMAGESSHPRGGVKVHPGQQCENRGHPSDHRRKERKQKCSSAGHKHAFKARGGRGGGAGRRRAPQQRAAAWEGMAFVPRFKSGSPAWAAMHPAEGLHMHGFADSGGAGPHAASMGSAGAYRSRDHQHFASSGGVHEAASSTAQQCWFTFDDHSDFEYAFRPPRHGSASAGGGRSGSGSGWSAQGGHEQASQGGAAGRRQGGSDYAAVLCGEAWQHLQTLELTALPRTAAGLRSAYLRAAKKHHPDVGGPTGAAGGGRAHQFHAVQTAYEHLKATLASS